MHKRIAIWSLLVVAGAGIVFGTLGNVRVGLAQEAAPSGVIPDPALCQTAPRTVDEIIAMFADATIVEPAPLGDVTVPTGSHGNATTTEDVTAAANAAVACLNAGEWLQFFGLLTEHAIVTAFPWIGEEIATNGVPAEFENPTPLPADMQQSILAVGDISSLDADRAGAFLVLDDPTSSSLSPTVLHLTFVRDGDIWLIDEVLGFTNE